MTMADIGETVKNIKPIQWAMIAGAGVGLGLLLRMRNKGKVATAAANVDAAQQPVYSGTGQTGFYQGNADGGSLVNPNSVGQTPTTPVSTGAPVYAGFVTGPSSILPDVIQPGTYYYDPFNPSLPHDSSVPITVASPTPTGPKPAPPTTMVNGVQYIGTGPGLSPLTGEWIGGVRA